MNRRSLLALPLAVASGAVLGVFACEDPKPGYDMRRDLLESWTTKTLLSMYVEFEAVTRELDANAQAFCAAPSADGLATLRQSWWNARAPWKRAEVFAFGPYRDEPLRIGPKVDFWPARTDAIEAVLVSTEPLSVSAIEAMGTTTKGMPVIEYLVYQSGLDLVATFSASARRCEYLKALTLDLSRRAEQLRMAWDPGAGNYAAELIRAGHGSRTYDSLQMALGEVVNRMAHTVENIRSDKLGRPLGTATGGSPQPDKAESRFSGRSIDDIRDNLRGIERLFFGDAESAELGLRDYLASRGHDFDAQVRTAFAASFEALAAISEPLSSAVSTSPVIVQTAIDRLGELQRTLQVDVTNALGITVGFNDNDGD